MDNFAILFKIFFLSVAILVLGISFRYFREGGFYQGEYYFLLLTSFLGCVMMPSSRDLLLLFIALELVSAPGFLMAAFRKGDPKSNEAGLKFFLIGVLSTAVMLYGMSLIYGLTGTTRLDAIAQSLSNIDAAARRRWRSAAILFVVIGFAFKVSRGAVPVLGAGHVRGRAGAGGGVPGGRVQRGRVRRTAAADVRGVHPPARVLDADLRGRSRSPR